MNKVERVEQLQKVFRQAVENLTEAFNGLKAEIIEVDQPEYKTVKRDAKVGDKILITNPSLVNAGEKGEIFTVSDAYEGFVDVEEIKIYYDGHG